MSMSADAQPGEFDAQPAAAAADVIPIDRAAATGPRDELEAAIASACDKIAPLWPLQNFVAVNPFLGLTGQPFEEAAKTVGRLFHARIHMPHDFYHQQLAEGRIGPDDLLAAIADLQAQGELPGVAPEAWAEALQQGAVAHTTAHRVETLAEAVDREEGAGWSQLVVQEIAKWCAGRFDQGQAAWAQPDRDQSVFSAWRSAARIDRGPEAAGLAGFRSYAGALPDDPHAAIETVLEQLHVPADARADFLARQLASVAGWAGRLQWQAREAGFAGRDDDSLVHLLAIRLAFDGALDQSLGARSSYFRARLRAGCSEPPAAERAEAAKPEEETASRVWQLAYEGAWRRSLLRQLSHLGRVRTVSPRPRLQAAFCIDVRSERLRRHLEQQSAEIQTIGFAGFFGFPLELVRNESGTSSSRCPALIPPAAKVGELEVPGSDSLARDGRARRRHAAFAALRKLAVGAYPFVETVGHFFGLRLVSDALGFTRPHAGGALWPNRARAELVPTANALPPEEALSYDEQVDMAEGALRGMGLTKDFAEVVLLCGHGSLSTNNPYASSLDCGACGGHSGDVNARVAAAVLDSPSVRRDLKDRGIDIPSDTVFVAGLHDTTRDRVTVFDAGKLGDEQRARLEAWLGAACAATRAERATDLDEREDAGLLRRIRSRSRDWSELRPEWGLAGNAAFLAAPRARTRAVDLEGRVFLHDYEAERDPEGALLETILTAPLVVASWINLQYYASTTDNEVFGSGNKALHNVVGRHGVQLGNRSDLQVGLPWQSVHDGKRYVHEPMRLTAIVEAPQDRIERIVAANADLRALVENEWLVLLAWEGDTGRFHRMRAVGSDWEEVTAPVGADA